MRHCTGLQKITRNYRRLHGIIEDYMGLSKITGIKQSYIMNMRLLKITRDYVGLKENTQDY